MAAAVPVRVPVTLEEAMSPEWLSAALATPFPGVSVTKAVPGRIDARVSTNAAVHIECEGGLPEGLPADLWVKAYFGEGRHATRDVGAVETSFYRALAGPSGVRTLQSLIAVVDEQTQLSVLVTADVAAEGGTFLDPKTAYTPDQTAEGLAQLAGLHSATWRSQHWRDVPWLAARTALRVEQRAFSVRGNLAKPTADGVPAAVRDAGRLIAATEHVAAEAEQADPWAVVHGDPHTGNVFLDGQGRVGFLDWQLVHRGAWYLDVGYHLAAMLSVEDRRRSERDLVKEYLGHLVAAGIPAPSLGDASDLIRRGMVYGMYLWSITSMVTPETTAVMLERLGTAVDDHDGLDLGG